MAAPSHFSDLSIDYNKSQNFHSQSRKHIPPDFALYHPSKVVTVGESINSSHLFFFFDSKWQYSRCSINVKLHICAEIIGDF